MADNGTAPFKKGSRVVATTDLKGVPEGTAGKVGVSAGITWRRYWVRFDNGREMGTVPHSKLVAEKEWPTFAAGRARRDAEAATSAAEQAIRAAAQNKAAADASPAGSGGGDSTTDRLAALAAKSKAAREAKGTSDTVPRGGDGGTGGDDAPADDRLAALMARSKAARQAKS